MAKGGEELVKYITEQVVHYIETPRQVRKEARVRHKETRESWSVHWFGMIPLSVSMLVKAVKRRNRD
ncbi:YqzE family protein [Paenibacillus sp. UNC499MF]|uniref:YqzE family protein n=1 Tax=Paenibacillus sp. UNC499MF TaxID=1502751 RepID=UPI0008A006E4|nr:YqzE family protein [Paenibacillus sp. UNC499MF]SEG73412.1 YqzE-like protein [Paenibacillus sp. UNC499MF]